MKRYMVRRNPKHPWHDWWMSGRPLAKVHRGFYFTLEDIERYGGRVMYEDELSLFLTICEGIPGWRIAPDIEALTRDEVA